MNHEFLHIVCSHCGKRFDVPLYCGDRFCSVCGFPRRMRIRARLRFLVENVQLGDSESIKHITFTIPSELDLAQMIKRLVRSFRKLRQTKFWKRYISGGAFVIEITGEPGQWHGHIHCICQAGFVPWAKLKSLWEHFSGGKGVYITRIPLRAAVNYLTKYLSKSTVATEFRYDVSEALKGLRFFQPFGSWYHQDRKYPKPSKVCSRCKTEGSFCLAYEMLGGWMHDTYEVVPQDHGPPKILRKVS